MTSTKQRAFIHLMAIFSIAGVLAAIVAIALSTVHSEVQLLRDLVHRERSYHDLLREVREEVAPQTSSHGFVTLNRKVAVAQPYQPALKEVGWVDFSTLLQAAVSCNEQCPASLPVLPGRRSNRCCSSLDLGTEVLGNLLLTQLTSDSPLIVTVSGALLVERLDLRAPILLLVGGSIDIREIYSAHQTPLTLVSASGVVQLTQIIGDPALTIVTPEHPSSIESFPLPRSGSEVLGLVRALP